MPRVSRDNTLNIYLKLFQQVEYKWQQSRSNSPHQQQCQSNKVAYISNIVACLYRQLCSIWLCSMLRSCLYKQRCCLFRQQCCFDIVAGLDQALGQFSANTFQQQSSGAEVFLAHFSAIAKVFGPSNREQVIIQLSSCENSSQAVLYYLYFFAYDAL